jgi:hypothetical protein
MVRNIYAGTGKKEQTSGKKEQKTDKQKQIIRSIYKQEETIRNR